MIEANRRVAIYTRVSTDGQTCANQEREFRAVAERQHRQGLHGPRHF
jgi:DNA invertase Pin-like site-specific DNA recombinase